jgi:hypothetical protein
MDVCPGDIVIRMAPVPPERKRERSGLVQYGTYEVAAVAAVGEVIRVSGVNGWHLLASFEVVHHEPCA